METLWERNNCRIIETDDRTMYILQKWCQESCDWVEIHRTRHSKDSYDYEALADLKLIASL